MNIRTEIAMKRDKRNWNSLPASFEFDSVQCAFQDIKGLFNKSEISKRIQASKAQTFTELYVAIS